MKTTTPRTSPLRTPRTPRAKAVPRAKGSLTRPETTKLVMQAQEAYHYQTAMGLIDAGTTFDAWRRDQVMSAVGLGGISKIGRSHWRPVFAHFLTLAGRADEAYAVLTTTGPKRDHGPAGDTHESSEALVHQMREALFRHSRASIPPGAVPIHPGWLLAAARQRTGKPTLTWDTMAERLHPGTLVGLLSHLRNHIARREGRESDRRSQRSYPARQDPGSMHEDTDSEPF